MQRILQEMRVPKEMEELGEGGGLEPPQNIRSYSKSTCFLRAIWPARSFTVVVTRALYQSVFKNLLSQKKKKKKSRSVLLAGNGGSCFVHSETGEGQE